MVKRAVFIPGASYGDIKIGMDRDEVIAILGCPANIGKLSSHNNNFTSVYWCYNDAGIDVEFDPRGGGRVTCVHVYVIKFPGYSQARFYGPRKITSLYRKFGKPALHLDMPSGVYDVSSETWGNGYHAFIGPGGKISSFSIFDKDLVGLLTKEEKDKFDDSGAEINKIIEDILNDQDPEGLDDKDR